MFQLDEKFLDDVGLSSLPEEQRKPFLQHVYSELELRVGTKLSEGMTEKQLSEFEAIIDRAEGAVDRWLSENAIDYHNDPLYEKIKSASKSD